MEQKINIAELLKECPAGMELDCTLFEGLEFDCIIDNEYLPIRCRIKHPNGGYNVYNFTKYGCWIDATFAKCVIFPKGKTTWEGFEPHYEFKDGDILTDDSCIFIFQKWDDNGTAARTYCALHNDGYFEDGSILYFDIDNTKLATEEEKEMFFKAINDNGYRWNPESKTLERVTYPKTYLECREMLGESAYYGFSVYATLQNLIICRNAYWKIAGEQMGLGKPWEPDFTNDDEERYGIYTAANKVVKDFCGVGDVNMILTFPTEKMRDEFCNNFDPDIEFCKEFL
jgi:hypothetical protein